MSDAVRWHDVECGPYAADLPLWRELAAAADGPILDVGCGTGRVTLDLARRGHAVTGLDVDPELLAALRERAQGLPVETVAADARAFTLARRFALCVVPMQTVQLLGGGDGRTAFLRCARGALVPGGTLAIALADPLESFDADHDEPPTPDVLEFDGVVYASQPVAVREAPASVTLERVRRIVARDGSSTTAPDTIELARLSAAALEREGRAAGLAAVGRRAIPATDEYVGSTVVVLRA